MGGCTVVDPGVVRWVRSNPLLTVELIKTFGPAQQQASSIKGNIERSVTN